LNNTLIIEDLWNFCGNSIIHKITFYPVACIKMSCCCCLNTTTSNNWSPKSEILV